jgi:N-acetylneuraminate synthase
MSAFVIAEAGVNHNGSLEMALRLVDAAADAGANAVKFQTFKANQMVSAKAPKASYQELTTCKSESQFEMLRKLELSDSDHLVLLAHARKRRIEFLSTPFDLQSLNFLVDVLGLRTIKIPSGEITNGPLVLEVGRSGCRVILSTGMSTLAEIEDALSVLAFGFMSKSGKTPPSLAAFRAAYASEAGQRALREQVTLLQCTTEYPAAIADINLRAMDAMASAFLLPVGYSDHTEGIHVAVAAVARGATIIEKHFTLDRNLPGPDHRASIDPGDLTEMVKHIRDVELALGNGVKRPSPVELTNRRAIRKSLVAARTVSCGETFLSEDLACKRPGSGRSPMDYWEFVGTKARQDYLTDEEIGL